MTFPLPSDVLSAAFIAACEAELRALKPGNVHIHGAGHGMEAKHFEDAAKAAAPWIADASLKVGARILGAVDASLAAAGCNTNLGIVLLCVPLAAAADASADQLSSRRVASPSPCPSPQGERGRLVEPKAQQPPSPLGERVGARGHEPMHTHANRPGETRSNLRERLGSVLANLDREDAANVFQAIVRANPAGLGKAGEQDVAAPPTATLREAMALAASRDRIARAYVTDYEDIFEFGLPQLERARRHAEGEDEAISTLHMSYLAAYADSHIIRKHGAEAALEVREAARKRERLWRPAASRDTFPELLDFDRELKAKGLNPGTTADFVVAALYADSLITRGLTKCGA